MTWAGVSLKLPLSGAASCAWCAGATGFEDQCPGAGACGKAVVFSVVGPGDGRGGTSFAARQRGWGKGPQHQTLQVFLDALPNNPHYKHLGHNWVTKKWTVSCATCRRYVTRRQSWEAVRKVLKPHVLALRRANYLPLKDLQIAMLMHPGDPELLMLSLPVFCQSARTHRKSERKSFAANSATGLQLLESFQNRCANSLLCSRIPIGRSAADIAWVLAVLACLNMWLTLGKSFLSNVEN